MDHISGNTVPDPIVWGFASLSDVREIHFKFYVDTKPWNIPQECPYGHVLPPELDRRTEKHHNSPGENFIKNAQSVTPMGLGDQLVEAGFGFHRWSWHKKRTLHGKRKERAVIECVFSREGCSEWKDALISPLLDHGDNWAAHCWKNPDELVDGEYMITLNLTFPRLGHAMQRFQVFSDQITIVSAE